MDTFNELNDAQLLSAIRGKYEQHLREAEKFKRMIDAYNGVEAKPLANNTTPETAKRNENVVKQDEKKETFEDIVVDIFSDGKPRLVSELIKEYYNKTGKDIKAKDFSSKLSIRAKNGKLKNQEFKDLPLENRYWWGLKSWFDGDFFKPEQKLIIHEKYKNMKK